MYKSVLRLAALVLIAGTSMWADSITIDGASSTSMLGTWFGGRGFFPILPVVPTTPTPSTNPVAPPPITAPIVEAVSTATNGASGTSVNVFGSYSSTLYGEGLTYSNGTVTGNPVSLSATSAFTYNGYLSSLPSAATLENIPNSETAREDSK